MSVETTPIMEFKDREHLQECIEWWKKRLFLNNWIIKGNLVGVIKNDRGEILAGNSVFQIDGMCGVVNIAEPTEDNTSRIVKYCGELTVVHELLHFKLNWLSPPDTLTGQYFDTLEHQQLEQFAKGFIMTKYNLPLDWFRNF